MFGGEKLDAALVAGPGPRLEGVHLLNHDGPTEATVGCTAYRFEADQVTGEGALPIGQPVWNSRAYVVDPTCAGPRGEEGELVLAGLCVADGYLGGGDEDRARFIDESAMAAIDAPGPRPAPTAPATAAWSATGRALPGPSRRAGEGARVPHRDPRGPRPGRGGRRGGPGGGRGGQIGLGGLELFVVAEGDDGQLVGRVLEHLRANLPAAAVPSKVWVVSHLVANAHGKWDAEATRAALVSPAGGKNGGWEEEVSS